MPETPDEPTPPADELLQDFELTPDDNLPDWAQAEIDRPIRPMDSALDRMRQALRHALATTQATIPQTYGYVLTWGLVPDSLGALGPMEEDPEAGLKPVFFILTLGGEFLPLTPPMIRAVQPLVNRVNGIPLLVDMDIGLATWSTAQGMPVTHLELVYMTFSDPSYSCPRDLQRCYRESLTARGMESPIVVTLAKRPDGWPL
jgi:hypothetical protein